jgi:hypothetical protein
LGTALFDLTIIAGHCRIKALLENLAGTTSYREVVLFEIGTALKAEQSSN